MLLRLTEVLDEQRSVRSFRDRVEANRPEARVPPHPPRYLDEPLPESGDAIAAAEVLELRRAAAHRAGSDLADDAHGRYHSKSSITQSARKPNRATSMTNATIAESTT